MGRAVLPAREGWWPTWVRRLLGQKRKVRRRGVGQVSHAVADTEPLVPMPPAESADAEQTGEAVTTTSANDVPVYTGPVSMLAGSVGTTSNRWASPRGW